ncbi:MAG: serine/threonine-protein kinase [Chloroflexota bacterium]
MTVVPGQMLGRYRVIESIGKGGMATVFRAFQPSLDRYVAIKVLPDHLAAEPGFRERFRAEALAIARLNHPNIPSIFEFGYEHDVTGESFEARGEPADSAPTVQLPGANETTQIMELPDNWQALGASYLVTELAEGGTLAELLARELPGDKPTAHQPQGDRATAAGRGLSVAETVRILGPIASALDYAHRRGVIHRDVKPSNILFRGDGVPLLGDFGLSRMIESGSDQRLTRTGIFLGTPAYMSPEQAEGKTGDAASDRYSFAVVAYEMLTGQPPFTAETPLAVLLAVLRRPLLLPRTINPSISAAAERVLLKGLARDPRDRYLTVSDFIAQLSATIPPPTGVAPPRSRRRWALGAAGALLVATVTGIAVRTSRDVPPDSPPATSPGATLPPTAASIVATRPQGAASPAVSPAASPSPSPQPTQPPRPEPTLPVRLPGRPV